MRPALLAAVAGLVMAPAAAATPLQSVRVSSDVTATMGTVTLDDGGVAQDDLAGTVTPVSLGPIPAAADLDGYALLADGTQLLSFDTTVQLPGGWTAEPCDVVRWDGVAYTFAFQGRPRGVPSGVNVDAVAVQGSALLLSFDVSVDFGSFRADDEDLVQFDGVVFTLAFDGSAAGVDPGLDLDAADLLQCNGHLLLSFDGSGTLGGVPFGNGDVLEFDGATGWALAYHGPAGLDAVQAAVNLGPGPGTVFSQTLLARADKVAFGWATPADFHAVRGPLGSLPSYAVDLAFQGTGTTLADASLPAAGTGFWYLVKQSGCTRTSWQSFLGAEPGRDAALP